MSDSSNKETFTFRISLNHESESSGGDSNVPTVPEDVIKRYREDGFIVVPQALSPVDVDALNNRLEKVLRGEFDRQQKPDKAPRLLKSTYSTDTKERKPGSAKGPLGFSGNLSNVRVLQIINIHKADLLFRKLVTNPALGKVVADLAGWENGARLAQDQIWAKPPGMCRASELY